MSLRPDDRSSRARSKSPGGGRERDRSRSRSNVRSSKDDAKTTPNYEVREPREAGSRDGGSKYSSTSKSRTEELVSYPETPNAPYYPPPPGAPSYPTQPSAPAAPGYPSAPSMPYPTRPDDGWTMGDYKDLPPSERPGYMPPAGYYPPPSRDVDPDLAYGDARSPVSSRSQSYESYRESYRPQDPRSPQSPHDPRSPQAPYDPRAPQAPQNPRSPQPPGRPLYQYFDQSGSASGSRTSSYTQQYAQTSDSNYYSHNDSRSAQYAQTSQNQFPGPPPRTQGQNSFNLDANVVERSPYEQRTSKNRLSVDTRGGAPPSPGLTPRMDQLSVGGARPNMPGDLPPPSPLLEAYRGTYQSMSPMPLALRPADDDDDLDDLEPLSPPSRRSSAKGVQFTQETKQEDKTKRVKVYDPEEDAKTIAKALGRSKVDNETICDILPGLSHDQIVYLKKEYKKQVKVQGKGVNLSKHLKTKLTGNFGKAVYVTALGRWESEGYWANFFYQSHGSRRELLIESLMGRTNAEIWNIKDEFKDKRYSDDLVECMKKELKMDKFRTAVLMVLDEQRQEEQDIYPYEYQKRDADTLHKALVAPKGGESTMLEIILLRSDGHLREVLKIYETTYRENFPRAALKKSNNLVGEVIAHILNGVINKAARDALLLKHAIEDIAEKNKEEELRYELLISRLVRLHWDKVHLIRVKREYEAKYKTTIEKDIEGATKGDFADFMSQLCQTKQR